MDQIWLASPSPAMRLWPASGGATWRLNPAAHAWARGAQWNEAAWRAVAATLSEVHASSATREGSLADAGLRWRSLPMSTGWLIWFMPEVAALPAAEITLDLAGAEGPRAPEFTRQMEMAADAAGVGIWIFDPMADRSEWNRQMFLIHGLAHGSVPPGPAAYIERLVHPEERAALRTAHEHLLQTGEPCLNLEFRIVRPDGDIRWIDYRSRRDERDGQGLIVSTVLDATDRVADRALAERSLREKGAALRASAERSEFLAKMSHELRTPLNAVLGFAQLMEHDAAAVPVQDQLDRIVHIRQAGEQLLALVGDVLEHLKQELPLAGRVPAEGDDVADAADPAAAAVKSRPLSVLYIEDNPVNVILVEELVGMRPDTTLRCAVDGLGGVAEAEASRPDVVLVDMQLPDIDGFEVLRRLRASKSLARTAIIALSANGMSDDIARARAAGFDDYWTKPIDFRRFLQGLDDLARARRMPVAEPPATGRSGRVPAG